MWIVTSELEAIYAKFKTSKGVTDLHSELVSDRLYFSLIKFRPRSRGKLVVWSIWRWCQLYAPAILVIVARLGKRTRWADSAFRNFEQKVIDGNAFAPQALINGATFAVVDNPRKHQPPNTILVEDATQTLYDLARYHRQHIDVPVIGITGSVGKTTTTHLVNAILSKKFRTAFSHGSNTASANSINLLNTPADAEIIILEMSSIRRGFLNTSYQILQPTHGLITNTGLAHIDTFGSLENVRRGKWELLENVSQNGGVVFLNMNHAWLANQVDQVKTPICFGSEAGNDIVGYMLSADPFIKIRWQFKGEENFIDIETKLAGEHNLDNLLGAIALGVHFDVPPTDIVQAIEAFEPVEGRSQMFKWGSNIVYNEGYQCNAPSTLANLKSFASFTADRKMLILEQVGLIEPDHPVHQQIINLVKEMQLDRVIIIGERYFRFKVENAGIHLLNRAELRSWLMANPIHDTHIMLNVTGFMDIRKLLEELEVVQDFHVS